MKIKEKCVNKLLVEGNDDQHVIWAICEKYNIPEVFDVIDCEGITNLFNAIPIYLKQSDIESVGIIIDADINLIDRWEYIKKMLMRQGFIVPDELPETGLVLAKDNVKVGVWIMPSNNTNGMLEDFISFLVPPNDNLLPVVDNTLNVIEECKAPAKTHRFLK